MNRLRHDVAVKPATVKHADKNVTHLRAEIFEALAANQIDEPSLRRAVWTYVAAERDARTSLGHVIIVLTELVDAADIAPMSVRHALTRQVTLWSVERYYSYQSDGVVARGIEAEPETSVPMSRR